MAMTRATGEGVLKNFTSASVGRRGKDAVRLDVRPRWIASMAVTTFQRPAPDLQKIVDAWRVWTAGGEDVLPGRTMADLKIGGTDKVLETLAADNEAITATFDIWMAWEKGKTTPEAALASLTEAGFADIVEALSGEA